jgi:hypothetical protein
VQLEPHQQEIQAGRISPSIIDEMLTTFAEEWEQSPDKAILGMFQIAGDLEEDLPKNFVANVNMKSQIVETIKKLGASLQVRDRSLKSEMSKLVSIAEIGHDLCKS